MEPPMLAVTAATVDCPRAPSTSCAWDAEKAQQKLELTPTAGLTTCTNIEPAPSPDAATAIIDDEPPPALPQHLDPLLWTPRRKLATALLTSLSQLITLMTASLIAPSLPRIARALHTSPTTAQLTLSIYILGLAVGPFAIAPASEVYGRRPLWLGAQLVFVVFNSLCPVGETLGVMVVGRLLAGVGASGGTILTGPIMGDIYGKGERGRGLAAATLLPYLGPALGPVVGGVVGQRVAWRWVFWVVSVADVGVMAVGWWGLRESYAPVLRRREDRRGTGQGRSADGALNIDLAESVALLKASMTRPALLLWRQPALQIVSLLYGLDFGIYILVLSSFATLWIEKYGLSETESSLHYIAIALGSTIASQGGGLLMDCVWRILQRRYGEGNEVPEFRMPMLALASAITPVGLIWYGWAAEKQQHWVVVDAGVFIFNLGGFAFSQALTAYLLDEYVEYAASASAAMRFLSNVMGFAFPLCAPKLYEHLGYGWGNTLLGLVFAACGWPAPLLLWKYGAQLRSGAKNRRFPTTLE